MFCDVAEKAQKLAYGLQSSSRVASWDAMEFAFRTVREVKATGSSHQVKFRLGKGLRPSMLQHVADVVGGIEVRFTEPQPGVFSALIVSCR